MIYELINGRVYNIRDNDFISNMDSFQSDDLNIRLFDYDPRLSVLNNLKNVKKHTIEDSFDLVMRNGYNTGNGYYLAAGQVDMDAFTKDALLHERAVALNILNADGMVIFTDNNSIPRTLKVSEYVVLLVNYGLWCRQQIMAKSYKMYLLDIASNKTEIDAI